MDIDLLLHSSINSVRSHAAAQQMHELDFTGYNGGVYHWTGPHNEFCEVCGGPTELFGCQTCNMSYHRDCMFTPMKDDEIFWFCPHCVDDKFHIPSDAVMITVDPSTAAPALLYTHTTYISPLSEGGIAFTAPSESSKTSGSYATPPTPFMPLSTSSSHSEGASSSQIAIQNDVEIVASPSSNDNQAKGAREIENRYSAPLPPPAAKRARPKRASSPPKKKSKYSTFSSEVDKALAIIHNELESAADNRKSENHLHEQIKSLEQQIKLQEGQMVLMRREHEKTKRELLVDRVKIICLENAVRSPHQIENELRVLIVEKDTELEGYRARFGNR